MFRYFLVPLAAAISLATSTNAATLTYSGYVSLGDFGDNDVACTTGGAPLSPVFPPSCSVGGTRDAFFSLAGFDSSLGTLTSAVLTYSYQLAGNFITRTPITGIGEFETSARILLNGSPIHNNTTGEKTYISSALNDEGTTGQRIDPYSFNLNGTRALGTSGNPLSLGLYYTMNAGIAFSGDCAFSNCGATNRVTNVFTSFNVTYTYTPTPVDPPPAAVPLPAASIGLLSALASLLGLGRAARRRTA